MKNELPKILEFLDGNANDNNLAFEKGYKPKITMFTVNKKTDLKFLKILLMVTKISQWVQSLIKM